MPRKEQGWITFQSSEDERALLEQYCQASQRTKTEILRALIRSLERTPSDSPQPLAAVPEPAGRSIAIADPRKPLKVSARNVLKGRIKQIVVGAVNSEVILEIIETVELVSVITQVSVAALELSEGQEAYAVIKSSDVTIAKD